MYCARTANVVDFADADGAYRLEDLQFFQSHRLGVESGWGLHGNDTQHLQQVVLDHVAQGAGTVIISGSVFDADGFGRGDLHMVDVAPIPQRLKHGVGETEDEDVLHRLFAQVVIDAEDLVLREHGMD